MKITKKAAKLTKRKTPAKAVKKKAAAKTTAKNVFKITETYNGQREPLYKQVVTYRVSLQDARGYVEYNFPDVSFNEHAGAVEEDVFDGDAIEDGIICKVTIVIREVPFKRQKLEIEGE